MSSDTFREIGKGIAKGVVDSVPALGRARGYMRSMSRISGNVDRYRSGGSRGQGYSAPRKPAASGIQTPSAERIRQNEIEKRRKTEAEKAKAMKLFGL